MTLDDLKWGSVLGELSPEALQQIAADPINCSQYQFALGNTGVVPGKLFEYLANEEAKHKEELEKLYYETVHAGGV